MGQEETRPGHCDVFWVDLGTFDESSAALVTDAERHRAAGFHQPDDRARSILGAALLRRAVADLVGIQPADVEIDRTCPRCGAQHGQPQLGGAALGWFASVTHAGELIGVALTQAGRVGLDVEPLTCREYEPLVEAMLNAAEPRPDSLRDFLTYWTRKESVLKATGDGLNRSMSDVAVSAPSASPRLVSYADRPMTATVFDLNPAPGHLAALTVLSTPTVYVTEHRRAAPR